MFPENGVIRFNEKWKMIDILQESIYFHAEQFVHHEQNVSESVANMVTQAAAG